MKRMLYRGNVVRRALSALLAFVFAFSLIVVPTGPVQSAGAAGVSVDWAQLKPTAPVQWINGNLNASKALYYEGMSVPQRLVMSGLTGSNHSVTFSYGYTKSGKHAYDFITSWNQAVSTASSIGEQTFLNDWRWIGYNESDFTSHTAVAVPSDSQASAKESAYESKYGNRVIDVYANGPIGDVTVSTPTLSGSLAGDSEMQFTVSWTGSATQVMVLFASHIAVGLDPMSTGIGWGPGTGAMSISGSPYHVSLVGGGSRDNQLQGSAIQYKSGVSGVKFLDMNGDGARQPNGVDGIAGTADDEITLSGWTIYYDTNGNGMLDSGEVSTATGSDGSYSLYFYLPAGANSGSVQIREVAKSGYTQTYPAASAPNTLNISAGQVVAGVNFGNMPSAHISLTKVAAEPTYDAVGDVINYTLVATNDGNAVLYNVQIVDPKLGTLVFSSAAPVTLAPGQTLTATGTHVVTQADIDAGKYDNTANAAGTAPNGTIVTATASASVPAYRNAALHLEKSATPATYDAVGDVISYTYVITNSGNVTLTGPFTVTDDKTTVTVPSTASLAPGASITGTAGYTITQADLDSAAGVTNIAQAHASYAGAPVHSNFDDATVLPVAGPALTLVKSASPATYDAVGDVISYTYVITNSGNVTLTGPFTVTDDKTTVTVPSTASLAPGASIIGTANYTITQADLDNAAGVTNVAQAHARFGGNAVNSNFDDATVLPVQGPELSLVKSGSPGTYDAVGDVISYTYVITNSGNVTLTGPFTVTDDKTTVTVPSTASLAPGASITGTASYVITQADLDNADGVTNIAQAHGYLDGAAVHSNFDDATVLPVQAPALTLVKSASPGTYDAVGDVISYTYVITNSGNVTLTGPFTVTDDKTTVTVPSTASLAPGASITGTASYVITQADLDNADGVTNIAQAHGYLDGAAVHSNFDDATVLPVAAPALTLVKSATPATYDAVGDVISYSYVLTNSGNVTLAGPFTVTDDKTSTTRDDAAGVPDILVPGDSITFSATYAITQADLDRGWVTNVAQGHASFAQQPIDSNFDDETVDAEQNPAISVVKSSNAEDGAVKVGSAVTYTYVVKNIGNVTLSNVVVTDDKLGLIGTLDELAVGASHTFTKSTTLSNLTTNIVTAVAEDPNGEEVRDDDTLTIDVFLPFVDTSLTKKANVSIAKPGDVVTYTLTYKNITEDPIDVVKITDDYDQRYMVPVNKAGAVDSNGVLTWTDAKAFQPGETRTITYTMKVLASTPDGTKVNNVAVITPGNHEARATVTISDPYLPYTGGEAWLIALMALFAGAVGLTFRKLSKVRAS